MWNAGCRRQCSSGDVTRTSWKMGGWAVAATAGTAPGSGESAQCRCIVKIVTPVSRPDDHNPQSCRPNCSRAASNIASRPLRRDITWRHCCYRWSHDDTKTSRHAMRCSLNSSHWHYPANVRLGKIISIQFDYIRAVNSIDFDSNFCSIHVIRGMNTINDNKWSKFFFIFDTLAHLSIALHNPDMAYLQLSVYLCVHTANNSSPTLIGL